MDKERVDAFVAAQAEIAEAAERARDIYCEIRGLSNKYLHFNRVEGDWIYFQGEETWQYGGHETHTLDLPLSHIYETAWIEEERQRAADLAEKAKAEAAAERERVRLQELAMLAKLKAKHEAA